MKKSDKEMLWNEFHKEWNDKRMTDYCTNQVASFGVLPDGRIVTVDKESIKTRFCFGEHGYDFDEVVKIANQAERDTEYFRYENMKHFTEWVNCLESAINYGNDNSTSWDSHVILIRDHYSNTDCKLASIHSYRLSEVIEAVGGSCYLSELPGQEVTIRYVDGYKVATKEEIEIILAAYKEAMETHRKKIDNYLKRYGMSKVYTWTYWADA